MEKAFVRHAITVTGKKQAHAIGSRALQSITKTAGENDLTRLTNFYSNFFKNVSIVDMT